MRFALPLALLLSACAPAPEAPAPVAGTTGAQPAPADAMPASTPAAAAEPPPPGMPARDFERVRAAVARGEYVPLAGIIGDALARHPGRLLEVELENDEYELEILGADGRILEFEYDARTGVLREIEVEEP